MTLSSEGCADSSGVPMPNAPAWCAEYWCYVDSDYCRVGGGAVASTFFPGAYYSVETCVGAGAARSSYGSGTTTASALSAIIENYLFTIAANVEQAWRGTAGGGVACDFVAACPCNRCNPLESWHCVGDTDLHSSNLIFRTNQDTTTAEANQMKCMSVPAGSSFNRIAAKEHTDEARVGFLMFGDQGSGGLLNWPANEWCTDEYDPRFRPWYSSSASGPKDVVIVIDISGSMALGGANAGQTAAATAGIPEGELADRLRAAGAQTGAITASLMWDASVRW